MGTARGVMSSMDTSRVLSMAVMVFRLMSLRAWPDSERIELKPFA